MEFVKITPCAPVMGAVALISLNRGYDIATTSRLAQLVERKTLNLVVVGSSPTSGNATFCFEYPFCVGITF